MKGELIRGAIYVVATSLLSALIVTGGLWAAAEYLDGKPQHDLRH